MRTALHRLAAGALAHVVSYALIGLLTLPRLGRYLTYDPGNGVTVFEVYRSAGSPLWQALGWFTLNANGVPITVTTESGNVISMANFVNEGAAWLGVIQGWFGLVPMVACLLVGVAVAVRSRRPSVVPLGVGAYMVPGYLLAVFASVVAFAGPFGPVDASVTLFSTYPADRWLIPVLTTPLVFGSLGALLGQSPVLTSTVERLQSESSLR